jgi:hypothetical protein
MHRLVKSTFVINAHHTRRFNAPITQVEYSIAQLHPRATDNRQASHQLPMHGQLPYREACYIALWGNAGLRLGLRVPKLLLILRAAV